MTQSTYSAPMTDALRAIVNTPDGKIYQTASALASATHAPTASLSTLKKLVRANLLSGTRGEAYTLTAHGRLEAERLGLIDVPVEDDEAVAPAEFAPVGTDEELADWKAFEDKQFTDDPLIEAREALVYAQARIAALEAQVRAVETRPAYETLYRAWRVDASDHATQAAKEFASLRDEGWTPALESFIVVDGHTVHQVRLERRNTPKPAPQPERAAAVKPTMIIDSTPLPTIIPVPVPVAVGDERRNQRSGFGALLERTRTRVQQVHANAETRLERTTADYDMAALTAAQEAYQDALSLMPALPFRSLEEMLDGCS